MSSRQYFDEVAHQWDKMQETFFSDAVREKAISTASVKPGKLAADIGAGTGFVTEGLIQTSARGVDSPGVRLLPHYLEGVKGGSINPNPNYKFVKVLFQRSHQHNVKLFDEILEQAVT